MAEAFIVLVSLVFIVLLARDIRQRAKNAKQLPQSGFFAIKDGDATAPGNTHKLIRKKH